MKSPVQKTAGPESPLRPPVWKYLSPFRVYASCKLMLPVFQQQGKFIPETEKGAGWLSVAVLDSLPISISQSSSAQPPTHFTPQANHFRLLFAGLLRRVFRRVPRAVCGSTCVLSRQRQNAFKKLERRVPAPPFYFISSYITALMVCIRFSASSKTMDWGDSNTSSVTSMASRPKRSPISLPTLVLWSW